MFKLSVFLFAAAALAQNLPAPGTCGPWVPQTDGTKWRLCYDIHGVRYCELKRGNTITLMQCPD